MTDYVTNNEQFSQYQKIYLTDVKLLLIQIYNVTKKITVH